MCFLKKKLYESFFKNHITLFLKFEIINTKLIVANGSPYLLCVSSQSACLKQSNTFLRKWGMTTHSCLKYDTGSCTSINSIYKSHFRYTLYVKKTGGSCTSMNSIYKSHFPYTLYVLGWFKVTQKISLSSLKWKMLGKGWFKRKKFLFININVCVFIWCRV